MQTIRLYNLLCVSCILWYTVNTACLTGCSSCSGHTCLRCESPYFLFGGNCHPCPDNCNSCKDYDHCLSCKPDKWNLNYSCANTCNNNCVNKTCQDDDGYCHQCKTGLYGLQCQRNCSLCENALCDLRYCTLGCTSGYYAYSDGRETFCQSCPEFCKTCRTSYVCDVCNDGFHLNKFISNSRLYGNCIPCPDSLQSCPDYCAIQDCTKCQVLGDKVFCTECREGFELNGDICVLNMNNCSEGCSTACGDNEICLGSCTKGWSGVRCSELCASQCLTCAKNNANVCEQCKEDFYTTDCNIKCMNHCKKVAGEQTCNIDNGYCLNGCDRTFWGPFCNKSCPKGCADDGMSKLCERINGSCAIGCKNGFTGPSCDSFLWMMSTNMSGVQTKDSTVITTEKSVDGKNDAGTEEERSNTIIIVAGAGGGFLVLILFVVLLFCFGKRRRKLENSHRMCNIEMNVIGTSKNAVDTDEKEVDVPAADTCYSTTWFGSRRVLVSDLQKYIKVKSDYKKEFEKLPKGLTRSCNEALKPENIAKNRYHGIYAYDATRVVLKSKNYVNANYIDGHRKPSAYIASQGPFTDAMNIFELFWEIIWQERTRKIVMLTDLEESGKMKCEQYWPNEGENKMYSDYSVSCTAEKEFSEFVVREFTISKGSETRSVSQFHYTAWPDTTVPYNVASLMELRDKVEQIQTTDSGPMLVHCSAGIGRTGTYIALDILVREGMEEGSVDIFGHIAALRGQRAHMVQNFEQYIFLHHCVVYALTCDPQPLSTTAVEHVLAHDKILAQYQTFMELQITPTDRKTIKVNTKRKGNRKGADIPGDINRVRLTYTKHDYINAVYMNGYLKAKKFIIAQTPLPKTVEDFVSMLYQEECGCIVCLDEEHVDDKNVGQYLPSENSVSRFGQFQVACRSGYSTDNFITRELNISRIGPSSSKDVSVLHYQFRGWACSEKVPQSAESFLNLVLNVEEARRKCESEQPTVVHCLTGAVRSGLFCGVSILLEKLSVEKELSVLNTVCQVRCRRRSAFKDIVHFRFCYACVKELLQVPVSRD